MKITEALKYNETLYVLFHIRADSNTHTHTYNVGYIQVGLYVVRIVRLGLSDHIGFIENMPDKQSVG